VTSSRKVVVIGAAPTQSQSFRRKQKPRDDDDRTSNGIKIVEVDVGKHEPPNHVGDNNRNSSNNSNDQELEPNLQVSWQINDCNTLC
jgi:hypothetical protein